MNHFSFYYNNKIRNCKSSAVRVRVSLSPSQRGRETEKEDRERETGEREREERERAGAIRSPSHINRSVSKKKIRDKVHLS